MKIKYLGTHTGKGGSIELPQVTTKYERIGVSWPDREPRYCYPEYKGGQESNELLGTWQWGAKGHEPGRYGTADAGLPPVDEAPKEELKRLSKEITHALDEMHANPDAYPEAADYFKSCAEYGEILKGIERPYKQMALRRGDEELAAVGIVIGNRRECSRSEMLRILLTCNLVEDQGYSMDWWVNTCDHRTLVTVTRGNISYAQPGQLPGGKCATLMFRSPDTAVQEHWADCIVTVR